METTDALWVEAADNDKIRGEPFDAMELDLAAL